MGFDKGGELCAGRINGANGGEGRQVHIEPPGGKDLRDEAAFGEGGRAAKAKITPRRVVFQKAFQRRKAVTDPMGNPF